MIYLTSDTHFGHTNILKHRPFKTVEEMDETIISNWNSIVTDKDSVYHLGDFALCSKSRAMEILGRLNGQKFLIIGNHDNFGPSHVCKHGWAVIKSVYGLHIDKSKRSYAWLSHFPHRSWNRMQYGAYHFYGHCHGKMENYRRSCDVGMDCWNFKPVSLDEAMKAVDIHLIDELGERSY